MSKRPAIWTAIHASVAGLLYLGAVREQQWAVNIVIFLVWLFLVIWLFAVGSEDLKDKMRVNGRSVPTPIAVGYDVLFLLALVAAGWFWSAGAWVFAAILENGILEGWDRSSESSANP
jgi:hypothetical protein